ncbi:S-methyl-5-thioribose-1-phosphate isomerase [Candidatus Micrarchaeota archaeon]|nr:S-methyl-5-thioribose-1-phosphate isomerase [Candidatus Micrarchaeota archaeon]
MRAIEFTGQSIRMIDQSLLPHREEWIELRNAGEIIDAIKRMKVRGAPAIGVAAAYALALSENPGKDAECLKSARPTAVELSHAVDFMLGACRNGMALPQAAAKWEGMNSKRCRLVSEHGSSLVGKGQRILTHCNTGFLAANEHGTALGAIKMAHGQGKGVSVYVDETRPRLQGALTSWELLKHGVPHQVVCDSAAGYLMKKNEIDLVMVGADRIAANGDAANKIGTYTLSVLARENSIPFYVLAPLPSFDADIKAGDEIEVEERSQKEVLEIRGKRVYPQGSSAENPAFDITPAENIAGFVCENGIFRSIDELWESTRDPDSASGELLKSCLR